MQMERNENTDGEATKSKQRSACGEREREEKRELKAGVLRGVVKGFYRAF